MSCDGAREKWWDHWDNWYKDNIPKDVQKSLEKGLKDYISRKITEILKGGSGRKLAPKKQDVASRRKTGVISPSRKKKPASPPQLIYDNVKSAAIFRNRDWDPIEREKIALKTRMFRRWVRTRGGAPMDIDPAHGKLDLPKISSQAGYAAVYDWMKESGMDMSSPLDAAYQAIWLEENNYSKEEKVKIHKLIEKTDIDIHEGKKEPEQGEFLVQEIRKNKSLEEIETLLAQKKAREKSKPAKQAQSPPIEEVDSELAVEEDENLEDVYFSAFHPKEAKVDKWYTLLVFAHLESALKRIQQDVEKFADEIGIKKQVRTSDSARLERGTPITIIPVCKGVSFNPDQYTFRWEEDLHRIQFRMRGEHSLADDAARGLITIFANGVLIGTLRLAMLFSDKEPEDIAEERQISEKMLQYAQIFISYSHKDKHEVNLMRAFIKGLGHRTLIDIDNLHAGEIWDDKLMQLIEQADVFQLFWSENSAASEYVKKEWTHALECEKLIVPVFWKKPLSPDPPPELKRIQFGYLPIQELAF